MCMYCLGMCPFRAPGLCVSVTLLGLLRLLIHEPQGRDLQQAAPTLGIHVEGFIPYLHVNGSLASCVRKDMLWTVHSRTSLVSLGCQVVFSLFPQQVLSLAIFLNSLWDEREFLSGRVQAAVTVPRASVYRELGLTRGRG